MRYLKNSNLEFIEIDEDNLVIYNPDNGDTHYINSTGKVILSLLDSATSKIDLIEKICDLYEGTIDEFERDIHVFLEKLIEKGIVIQP